MSAETPSGATFHSNGSGDTVLQDDDAREQSRQLSLQTGDAPRSLPGYEVLRCLGEGSFGAVWLMRELKTGKRVAVKFYTHRRGLDWSLLTREVEKLAVLYTSRNIVGLLDVGWNHDPPYFVMEFLESGSLAQRLDAGELPVPEAVRITRSLAMALVHAHGSGILHCDVKPANVLLDPTGEPRLGDFGQSRLTTEQSPALGTLYYMAPEQADLNAVPDARWDVYALGALLYHMLTGAPPYRDAASEQRLREAGSLEERLTAYRELIAGSEAPVAHRGVAGVDAGLAAIVDGCLNPDPEKRLPNAQVVLDLLEKRDARRAKRPLIALGFLGPIMFLLAMIWIAFSVGRDVMDQAERNLVDRALSGSAVSAELLADSIDQELNNRLRVLEGLAGEPTPRPTVTSGRMESLSPEVEELAARLPDGTRADFRAAMGADDADPSTEVDAESPVLQRLIAAADSLTNGLEDDEEIKQALWRLHVSAASELESGNTTNDPYAILMGWKSGAEDRLADSGRTRDQSWFVTDATGRQIFRHPFPGVLDDPDDTTIGDAFHWRDYFHGLGEELPRTTDPRDVSPRVTPGVSLAFRSDATGKYMVAIAVPVWDDSDEPTEVIGVLARTIHLDNLLSYWEASISGEQSASEDRFIALAEVRSPVVAGEPDVVQLLDHPWLNNDNLSPYVTGDENEATLDVLFSQLELRPEDVIRLTDPQRHRTESFEDPVGDPGFEGHDDRFTGEWLAAAAEVSPGNDPNWLAIVQERKSAALTPLKDLQQTFLVTGLWAGVVFSLLLIVLWYLINRASA